MELQGHSITYRNALGPQRDRLERICRYVSRSAVAHDRLSLTAQGKVRYALKSAYWDGTTQEKGEYAAALKARAPPLGALDGID